MFLTSKLVALFLFLAIATVAEVRRAYPISFHTVHRRQDFIGAIPLHARTCPSDQTDCGVVMSITHWCCPMNWHCGVDFWLCCPNPSDCPDAEDIASCARPEYQLYFFGNDYFCCVYGEVGYSTEDGENVCARPPLNFVPSSLLAISVNATSASPPSTFPTTATGASLTSSSSAAAATEASLTSSSSAATATGASLTSSSSAATATGASPTSSSLGGSGSDTVKIVGIAVGAGVGGLLLGLAVWLRFRHREKDSAAVAEPTAGAVAGCYRPDQPNIQPQ